MIHMETNTPITTTGNIQTQTAGSSTATGFAATLRSVQHRGRELDDVFARAGATHNLPPELLRAIAFHESGFQSNAVSSAGAMGLMQLMPVAAEATGVANPFDPEQNVMGGAKLLRDYLDQYDGNLKLTLAAYGAGSGAVAKHGGVPPYQETQKFVEDILSVVRAGDLSGWDGSGAPTTSGFLPDPTAFLLQTTRTVRMLPVDASSTPVTTPLSSEAVATPAVTSPPEPGAAVFASPVAVGFSETAAIGEGAAASVVQTTSNAQKSATDSTPIETTDMLARATQMDSNPAAQAIAAAPIVHPLTAQAETSAKVAAVPTEILSAQANAGTAPAEPLPPKLASPPLEDGRLLPTRALDNPTMPTLSVHIEGERLLPARALAEQSDSAAPRIEGERLLPPKPSEAVQPRTARQLQERMASQITTGTPSASTQESRFSEADYQSFLNHLPEEDGRLLPPKRKKDAASTGFFLGK